MAAISPCMHDDRMQWLKRPIYFHPLLCWTQISDSKSVKMWMLYGKRHVIIRFSQHFDWMQMKRVHAIESLHTETWTTSKTSRFFCCRYFMIFSVFKRLKVFVDIFMLLWILVCARNKQRRRQNDTLNVKMTCYLPIVNMWMIKLLPIDLICWYFPATLLVFSLSLDSQAHKFTATHKKRKKKRSVKKTNRKKTVTIGTVD